MSTYALLSAHALLRISALPPSKTPIPVRCPGGHGGGFPRRLVVPGRSGPGFAPFGAVMTVWQWCRSRSSMLTAVVCSGRNRPQDSKGQGDAMPSDRCSRTRTRAWPASRRRWPCASGRQSDQRDDGARSDDGRPLGGGRARRPLARVRRALPLDDDRRDRPSAVRGLLRARGYGGSRQASTLRLVAPRSAARRSSTSCSRSPPVTPVTSQRPARAARRSSERSGRCRASTATGSARSG